MISKEDDIIMLVVFGMLVVVLIAALISDTASEYSDSKKNKKETDKSTKEAQKYEGFIFKKNNLKYSDCPGCQRKFQKQYENFYAPGSEMIYEPNDGWLSMRGMLPWWNSTRYTRNMSYDLRGDVPMFNTCTGLCCGPDSFMPWWQSPIKPFC